MHKSTGTFWALKRKRDESLLLASGNYASPWIFSNRDGARRAAKECKEHGIDCAPVQIWFGAMWREITK